MTQESEHWLARYATHYHAWKSENVNGRIRYRRPIGLIESSFDADGTDYGGRADMNALFTLEVRHTLSVENFRGRIALAWANLRLQHVLLQSRILEDDQTGRREFVVEVCDSLDSIIEESLKSIVWVEDMYPEMDGHDFHQHCLNVGRIIDPTQCLSRLHVLPTIPLPNGNLVLRFEIIMAHQISDGLTAYNWFSRFTKILNMSAVSIEQGIVQSMLAQSISSRLPPAQEDLYPLVAGNKARQRWFWAIIRVLRYVKKGLPPSIVNPLRRQKRLEEAVSYPPKYEKILDYSEDKKPPMNSGHIVASLSPRASHRLVELCRSIKVSVGAGCFALAGLSMMEIYEESNPAVSNSERKPFTASFPLNPRAFFGFETPADSCMLAFSDGIVMPFLPSILPVEGRFKLIVKHANRELRMYQKRLKPVGENSGLDSHSPSRILADGYIGAVERMEAKRAPYRRTGVNPQGQYQPKPTWGAATCGVSSVGSTAAFFKPGTYSFDDLGSVNGKDLVADYRGLTMGVRARDNEFLIGSSTDYSGIISFGVSYDANAISEKAAEVWAAKIKSLLDVHESSKI